MKACWLSIVFVLAVFVSAVEAQNQWQPRNVPGCQKAAQPFHRGPTSARRDCAMRLRHKAPPEPTPAKCTCPADAKPKPKSRLRVIR